MNFPDQEYKDFFGGTVGTAEADEYNRHHIGIRSGTSEAINEHNSVKRMSKLRAAQAEIDEANSN